MLMLNGISNNLKVGSNRVKLLSFASELLQLYEQGEKIKHNEHNDDL